MAHSILLVDDDALLRRSLAYTLSRAGYTARTAATAAEAIDLTRQSPPDLILLDIGLPGIDGLDALHLLRRDRHVPVILLTARRSDQDETLGLQLGADDYVKKPYDTDVLLARIAAVLRRAHPPARLAPPVERRLPLRVGNLLIDPSSRTATAGDAASGAGAALDLTPRAFDLLYLLASQVNTVVPLGDILRQLWGPDYVGEPQVLYVHIRWLRERLACLSRPPVRIVTAHRVGYKLVVEEDPCSAPSEAA